MKSTRSVVVAILFIFLSPFLSVADEGMWLLTQLQQLSSEMQKKGLKLTPDQIYSINQSSLKDAVVLFGGGCTGEVISKDGLILTNHHCGYAAIQYHSSVQHDYLNDGFWAMNRGEEKPTPGLTVQFVVRIQDVTDRVYAELGSDTLRGREKENRLRQIYQNIEEKAVEGTHYKGKVYSFFEENQFILFVYEEFTDIRMVGAPPESIGNFGGDTDNWMWPRHTGDFSLFRIYADSNGKPAPYSSANIPLKTSRFLSISMAGFKKEDFTMIMGFPGTIYRYITSDEVRIITDYINPAKFQILDQQLVVLKEQMDKNSNVRIQYASKKQVLSNTHKALFYESLQAKKYKVAEKKEKQETDFIQWASAKDNYSHVLSTLKKLHAQSMQMKLTSIYLKGLVRSSEALFLAIDFTNVDKKLYDGDTAITSSLQKKIKYYFKDFDLLTDQKTFAAVLDLYLHKLPLGQQPEALQSLVNKSKADLEKYVLSLYKKSLFSSSQRMDLFLKKPSQKILERDPLFKLALAIIKYYKNYVVPQLKEDEDAIKAMMHLYVKGLMEMNSSKNLYPDANHTIRFNYGQVMDCSPRDAVHYNYFTTLDGVIEKDNPNDRNFTVPEKLKYLYQTKNYGRYARDGKMIVDFTTTNDLTGGNSGSPVMNGKGELIGVAFDGSSEALFEKIAFYPELNRAIVLDIRYVLFIIDKFAGAGHLVQEMNLVE